MKKIFIGIIIGAIIFGGIGVASAAYTIYANNIEFTPSDSSWKKANGENITNVKDAIDDMYHLINENTTSEFKKVCSYVDNTYSRDKNDKYSIGTKYECDPGDGVKRNFYILKVNGENIDLIMEQNIAKGTMTWYNAMKYFRTGDGTTIKSSWTDVQNIDLPKAQDIADAVGRTSWVAAENSQWWCLASHKQDSQSAPPYCNTSQASAYNWLYDYTRSCNGCSHSLSDTDGEPYGYWTRDGIVGANINSLKVWSVYSYGLLSDGEATYSNDRGVRPVITVYRSNLNISI